MNDLNLRSNLIKDTIRKFSNVIRAENIQQDALSLYATPETIDKIDNVNNQVIQGRRGTGKTHLLLAFAERLIDRFDQERQMPIYIDLRKIKPLIQESPENSISYALIAFVLIIQEVFATLAENIKFLYNLAPSSRQGIFESLKKEQIVRIYNELNLNLTGQTIQKLGTLTFSTEEIKNLTSSLKISAHPEITGGASSQIKQTTTTTVEKVITFSGVVNSLQALLETLNIKIVCLLDEWSEIPVLSQPYIAELLKRVFIPSRFVFKIAAIPFRSRLQRRNEFENVGLEEGGDIFPFLLDNRYVFEINKQETRDFYNELLYKHLTSLEPKILDEYSPQEKETLHSNFINQFFANQSLAEILVASGGVPRDFCNLLINSYDKFLLNSTSEFKRIVLRNVREATANWYDSDKRELIEKNPNLKILLSMLMEEIVVNRKKTQFLMPQQYETNIHIQELMDLRVLHLRRKGYSHQDIKGAIFNVYSIDYGCYTSLNVQRGQLDSQLLETLSTTDDLREIRRTALDDAFFGKYLISSGEGLKCKKCGQIIDTNHLAYVKQKICNHCFEKIE
jgi:hypothetical protein